MRGHVVMFLSVVSLTLLAFVGIAKRLTTTVDDLMAAACAEAQPGESLESAIRVDSADQCLTLLQRAPRWRSETHRVGKITPFNGACAEGENALVVVCSPVLKR